MKPTGVTVTISYDTGANRVIQVDEPTLAITLDIAQRPDPDHGMWLISEHTGTGTVTIAGKLDFDQAPPNGQLDETAQTSAG